LWRQGDQPDLATFVAQIREQSPEQLTAVLRVDQRMRWQNGERVLAESYLEEYPRVRSSRECALDVIYGEYLMREKNGEQPDADEFVRRFPECADELRAQIDLHKAMAAHQDLSGECSVVSADSGTLANHHPPLTTHNIPGFEILSEVGRGGMGVV